MNYRSQSPQTVGTEYSGFRASSVEKLFFRSSQFPRLRQDGIILWVCGETICDLLEERRHETSPRIKPKRGLSQCEVRQTHVEENTPISCSRKHNFTIMFRPNSLPFDCTTVIHFKIDFTVCLCQLAYQQVSTKFSHLKSTNTIKLHCRWAKGKKLKLVIYQLFCLFIYLLPLLLCFLRLYYLPWLF